MFGSILASFMITVTIVALLQTHLPRITSAIGLYMAYLPKTIGNILFLVLFVCIFLFCFFLFMRGIVRNMRTLADGLMSIAGGDLDYRVPLSRHDELGEVARNINFMAERLKSMMDRERQIETSKMELITNVSHDLRTPLTSMIGYLNLLQQDDYRDLNEHKRYIRNAFNKSQQLKKLIDDLFEYTRLTSGSVRLARTPIDVGGLLEQIVTEFEPIAGEHGLRVKETREPGPAVANVDAEKLVRAIDNLLMNALKFSNKPGVIAVRLTASDGRIVIAVENWGKPVTKEQEQLLFERFYKAEPSRNDSDIAPGAGLGLSIARNIVELHGGRIGLRHRNGHFTFFIELPSEDLQNVRNDSFGNVCYDDNDDTHR
ncbi:two-component sensor histidine kinase [Paenibacillus flagellatus]|uniref:histidine kinase n=2 Tax=Paenibacillus flagellatus TaxID=2211139 RepID=A0A2V5KWH1_9BACL|nr:two-component sensor histidine kinase [Paenibacillus flagellatus]